MVWYAGGPLWIAHAGERQMTKKQQEKRMRAVVAKMQHYVATYSNQAEYASYTDKTFLDDMLYGIGIAMAEHTATDHTGPGGYERFKETLRKHLGSQS